MTQPKDYIERVDFNIEMEEPDMFVYKFIHKRGERPTEHRYNELEQRAIYQKLHEKFEGKK